LVARDGRASSGDLPDGESEIFLAEDMDRAGKSLAAKPKADRQWTVIDLSFAVRLDGIFVEAANDTASVRFE
jgi:hypothetical protein